MANKKRRKYVKRIHKENKKNKSLFRTFLIIAAIIIATFFIWQLIITYYQQKKKEPILSIQEDSAKIDSKKTIKSQVESAIDYALKRLEVPDEFIETKIKGNTIIKKIVLDTNQLSLTIANIFITDKVEEAGGQVITVKESNDGNSIEMKLYDPKIKKYFLLKISNDTNKIYKKITKLSIIIDDFGYFSGELLEKFLSLDKNISFSILPELPYSQEVMQKAYNQGRETIIHIPMEPISYPQNDPGKNAIFANLSEKKIEKRVKKYIKNLPLCIGANNHMGSLAMQYRNVVTPVLKVLKENNLFFIDSRTTPKTIGYELAQEIGIPTYMIDFFLDTGTYSDRVSTKTKRLLELAKTQNEIVVISHCTLKSLKELKQILENIEDKNFKLVPISEIVLPEKYAI